jgi:hypothetical protein
LKFAKEFRWRSREIGTLVGVKFTGRTVW